MIKIIRQTREMETETIEKNGENSKGLNRKSRINFFICGILLLVFCGFGNKAMGQSWSLNNGTLTISDNSAFSSSPYPWANRKSEITKLSIGSGVTYVPGNTFSGYSNLRNVTIEDGSTTLSFQRTGVGEGNQFYGCPIQQLYLGRNINYWDVYPTFKNVTTLTTLTIGNNVTEIGRELFSGCSGLLSVIIPNSVTSIGGLAFYNCEQLGTLSLGNNLKTIAWEAFRNCRALSGVTIPKSVTYIGDKAFYGCNNLRNVTIEDGTTTLSLQQTGTGEGNQFYGCNIQKLHLGRNISYWDVYPTFKNITALTALTIGNNVTEIGRELFSGCSGLLSLTIPNSVISIGGKAFYNCEQLGTLSLGNNLQTIAWEAFRNCRALSGVTIPKSVTYIGDNAFNSCSNIQNVTIEDSPTTLSFQQTGTGEGNQFYGCLIKTVYLGRNIDFWDVEPAFKGITTLTTIIIGNSVTKIGNFLFYGCTNLSQITSNATTPPTLQSNTFNGVGKSIPVYINCNYLSSYQTAQYWKDFTNYQCIATGINDIHTNQLSIFPNPAQNELFIKSELQIKKVEIYSLTGALLLSENNFNEKISISSLLKGIYVVKIYTDNGLSVNKIVKE